jgi:hypothetical protein
MTLQSLSWSFIWYLTGREALVDEGRAYSASCSRNNVSRGHLRDGIHLSSIKASTDLRIDR